MRRNVLVNGVLCVKSKINNNCVRRLILKLATFSRKWLFVVPNKKLKYTRIKNILHQEYFRPKKKKFFFFSRPFSFATLILIRAVCLMRQNVTLFYQCPIVYN